MSNSYDPETELKLRAAQAPMDLLHPGHESLNRALVEEVHQFEVENPELMPVARFLYGLVSSATVSSALGAISTGFTVNVRELRDVLPKAVETAIHLLETESSFVRDGDVLTPSDNAHSDYPEEMN